MSTDYLMGLGAVRVVADYPESAGQELLHQELPARVLRFRATSRDPDFSHPVSDVLRCAGWKNPFHEGYCLRVGQSLFATS